MSLDGFQLTHFPEISLIRSTYLRHALDGERVVIVGKIAGERRIDE